MKMLTSSPSNFQTRPLTNGCIVFVVRPTLIAVYQLYFHPSRGLWEASSSHERLSDRERDNLPERSGNQL